MDSRARFIEKRDFLIEWLLEFQYTTPKVLCAALGLERKSQGYFLLSLDKSGLFKIVRSPMIREKVIILSHSGKLQAAMLSEKAESYTMIESRIAHTTLIHSLSIQMAMIQRASMTRPFAFRYDKNITNIATGKRPDAIYDHSGTLHALEVELTQKSSKRVYAGFFEQIENMKAGHYNHVEYVFPSEALMLLYKKRFDEEFWPLFYRDKHGKLKQQVRDGELVTADARSEKIRTRFSFNTEDLYQQ
ncbi:hypothetical protein [Methylophaga sp.]|uniref:hypothetical protein n=1 Tax=Methylophaga sp. TaxID=2024840 RepID=UPI003A8EEC9F